MILADTNVALALLVDDRPVETAAVLTAFEDASTRGETVTITESVLVEVCTALKREYGLNREEIAEAVGELLATLPLAAWDGHLAAEALDLMSRKPALSVTDCLLAARATRDGSGVLTFDRKLQQALQPG